MITGIAQKSGQFALGKTTVNRLGFGAMRITGDGIWGESQDRDEALRTLRRLPDLGINLIDTADSYGPEISERLIHEALHPYAGMIVATKGGLLRPGPNQWVPCGRPEYLRQQVLGSMRRLGVDQIALWQLHRIDPGVPRDEQFGAIAGMLKEGLIAQAGLSEVTVPEIEAAQKVFHVATVQNLYNLANRKSEDVLDYCDSQGIGFIPWFPLASGDLAKPGSKLNAIASKYKATPSQIALAWLLRRSSNMLPIPGTGKVLHLEQNAAAANIVLDDADYQTLSGATA